MKEETIYVFIDLSQDMMMRLSEMFEEVIQIRTSNSFENRLARLNAVNGINVLGEVAEAPKFAEEGFNAYYINEDGTEILLYDIFIENDYDHKPVTLLHIIVVSAIALFLTIGSIFFNIWWVTVIIGIISIIAVAGTTILALNERK